MTTSPFLSPACILQRFVDHGANGSCEDPVGCHCLTFFAVYLTLFRAILFAAIVVDLFACASTSGEASGPPTFGFWVEVLLGQVRV